MAPLNENHMKKRLSQNLVAAVSLLLAGYFFFQMGIALADMTPSDNPNRSLILSSIPIPQHTPCSIDPSDKYALLYVMCLYTKEGEKRHITVDETYTLYTYNVSDPRNPTVVSTLDLGKDNGISLPYMLVRQSTAVIGDFGGGGPSSFIILDLAEPTQPRIVSAYSRNNMGDMFLSDDGRLLAFRAYQGKWIYRYFDLSDLSAIKPTTYTPNPSSLSAFDREFFDIPYFSGLTRTSGYRSRRGNLLLYENFAEKQLQLYDVGPNGLALVKSEPHISSSQLIGGMRLLPGSNAVAFMRSSSYPSIEIESFEAQ